MSVEENDPAVQPEVTDETAADPQVEEVEAESPEESGEGADEQQDQQDREAARKAGQIADEIEIVIDGEEAKAEESPKDAAAWARIRKQEAETRRENAELKRKLAAQAQPQQAADPGPEPTLENCGWDEATLKAKHVAWLKANDAREAEKDRAAQQAEKLRRKWEDTKSTIVKSRDELIKQMPGYVEAEASVDAALNANQLGIIMRVCKDKTPMVIAALGRDPVRLKDVAGEEDVVDFISKVKELEGKVKTQKKVTTPPPPEKKIGGTGGSSGAVDAQEERLRKIAMDSGDSTELRKYIKSRKK